MSTVIYFPNLKASGDRPTLTGTMVGTKACMDVNVANSVAIPVALTSFSYKEHRFHDVSLTNINASAGAFIEVVTAAAIANTITEMRVNWNGGAAFIISTGADATAAALSTNIIAAVGQGQTFAIGVSLASGDKVWVRAMENAAITDGQLTLMFLGA